MKECEGVVRIRRLELGELQTNCYIAAPDDGNDAVIIDPGLEGHRVLSEIEALGLNVRYILNTHAHFDHVGANAELCERLEVPLALHPLDLPILRQAGGAAMFGVDSAQSPEPGMRLAHDQVIEVGTLRFRVLFTPGHTPGHVSFYESAQSTLFDGDVLFNGGIGRTDMPGGNQESIIQSIREVLFALPDQTDVYSGHGEPTTIGHEKLTNPWVRLA